MHIGRQFGVQLAQTRQTDVCDIHLCPHSGSHARSRFTHDAAAEYQHLGGLHAGHTTHQLALSALGLLQIVGTVD